MRRASTALSTTARGSASLMARCSNVVDGHHSHPSGASGGTRKERSAQRRAAGQGDFCDCSSGSMTMTDASEWTGPVGDVWAAEWRRTDRSFAGARTRARRCDPRRRRPDGVGSPVSRYRLRRGRDQHRACPARPDLRDHRRRSVGRPARRRRGERAADLAQSRVSSTATVEHRRGATRRSTCSSRATA